MGSLKVRVAGQDRPITIIFDDDIARVALKMRRAALDARKSKNNHAINSRNSQVKNTASTSA